MGLVPTVQWFCREFEELYPKHHIELDLDLKKGATAEDLRVVIFRIPQEALKNVAKHSKAEWADVSLRKTAFLPS